MRRSISIVACAMGALTLSVAATPALAKKAVPLSCGETITADTTLDSDLTKCAGPGIRIGADDITLDLNGNTIAGKGKGVGVNNTAGYDGVTIEGGSIRNFMESIALVGASDNQVPSGAACPGGIEDPRPARAGKRWAELGLRHSLCRDFRVGLPRRAHRGKFRLRQRGRGRGGGI